MRQEARRENAEYRDHAEERQPEADIFGSDFVGKRAETPPIAVCSPGCE